MGVSPACVAAVRQASGNQLDEAQATDLIRHMEDLRKAEVAKGNLDNLDARLRQLAAEGAERERIAAALAAKHAALSAIAFDRGLRDVRGFRAQGLDWKRSVLALFEGTVRNVEGGRGSVARQAMAYTARYLEPINRILVTDAEVAKRLREPGFAEAVTREMRELRPEGKPGITGDPAALRLARVYEQSAELARRDLNRHGAPIGRLDGWSPQAHAAERVVKVSQEEWADFTLGLLGRDRTFAGMSDELVAAALRDMYQRITTGTDRNPGGAEISGRLGPANLASSLAAARVLHFRDADAWLSYAARFGAGDIHTAMAAHLQGAAKYAAQLERFGPNPDNTITRMLAALQREAAADTALTPQQRQDAARQLNPAGRFSAIGSAWAEVSGLTAAPESITMAQIGTGIRTVQSLAKLGGAVVSSVLSDTATRAINLTYQGKPILAAWRDNVIEMLRGRGKGEQREVAAILNAGVEGMQSRMVAAGIAEDLPMGMAHKVLATFFRWQGLSLWQDMSKAGNARMLSAWMGQNAGRGFAQLDAGYQRVLRQQGISPAEWNAIRDTAWQAEDGTRYVTPDRLDAVPRQMLAHLTRDELEALHAGLAERVARRAAQDATEAEWVTKRTAGFATRLAADQAWMEKVSASAEGGRGNQVARLRGRMAEVEAALSELAEFHQALARGEEAKPRPPDVIEWRPGDPLPADLLAAEARAAELARHPTDEIMTPEREALRDQVMQRVAARRLAEIGGAPAEERKALIVIGPPSAGKSTILEPLARRMRALVIDSDDMKAELPEFAGGLGAMRVHEESSRLATQMRDAAIAKGANIALPLVGGDAAKLRRTVEVIKAQGYHVTLVFNELPIVKAALRNMNRFRETGRLVSHDYLMSIGDRPRDAYMAVKEIADDFAHYSNDVPRGQAVLFKGGSRDLLADPGGSPGPAAGRAGDGAADPRAQREDAAGAGSRGTFRPRSEQYLDEGDVALRAARAEGEARARLDRLRRLIGETNREAKAADLRRLEGFDERWRRRDAELQEFVLRMEARAEARSKATAAERGDWSNRVDRVLEDARRGLELKLRGFFADEQRFGYIETDPASRRVALLNTAAPPGTISGEFLRTLMQFKGFPIAFTQRVLGRAVLGYGAPGQERTVADRLLQGGHIGQVLLTTAALGYLTMSLKDAMRGYEPRDPTRLKTILAAMTQGGGAGIYGDFLFAEASRFGNKPLETAAGPSFGAAANLLGVFNEAKEGDAKAGRALSLVLQNTPFLSLWYVRPAADLLFLNELRETVSPGHLSRMDRERRRDYGQERWGPRSVWE